MLRVVSVRKIARHKGAYRIGRFPRSIIFCAIATAGSPAHAVTIDLPGNVELSGTAAVMAEYDDNVFLTAEDSQSDWLTRVTPALTFMRESPSTSLSGAMSMTRGVYQQGARENFSDYNANIEWAGRPFSLLGYRLTGSYADVAQSSGRSPEGGNLDGALDPILIETQRTRRPSAEFSLLVGRQGGRVQAAIREGRRDSKFEDAGRNFTTSYSAVDANYALSTRVSLGLSASKTDFEFSDASVNPARDSTETLVVAVAELTFPKSRLQLRGGRQARNFELEEREAFDGPRWDLTASWSPKTYSTLTVTTGRTIQESLGIADFVDVESTVFSWTHQWSQGLSSAVSYGETNGSFVGTDRLDTIFRSRVSLQYQPVDWLRIRLSASNLESTTSITELQMENNRYAIGIEAPL